MDLIEAIQTRHSVRKYTDQPIEVAKLAPTAVNQQKFKFILKDGNKVATKTFFSPWGYTQIDLGIVKYHFEIGAGKENFEWV